MQAWNRFNLVFLCLYLWCICSLVESKEHVLIMGAVVHRNSELEVLVYSNRHPRNAISSLTITGLKDMNKEYMECENLFGKIYICTFKHHEGDEHHQNFELSAILNDSSFSVEQSVKITTTREDFAVILQTDKTKFKPGDVVNMRLFFVDFNGRPVPKAKIKNFYIEIRNQYDEVIWSEGLTPYTPKVFTYQTKLSHEAFLGNYTIYVWKNIADDDDGYERFQGNPEIASHSQSFEVEKYVLPEFVVTIDTKKIVRPFHFIKVKIYATYTFGKSVVGRAKVRAALNGVDFFSETVDCDYLGFALIKFDRRKLRGKDQVKIVVEYEDILSRRRVIESTNVAILASIKKTLIMEPTKDQTFKPGMPFSINVYLKDVDGSFVDFSKEEVEVELEQNYKQPKCEEISYGLNKQNLFKFEPRKIANSFAQFTIDVPFNTSSMIFRANYEDSQEKLVVVKSPAPSEQYIRVEAELTPNREKLSLNIQSNAKWRRHANDENEKLYLMAVGSFGDLLIKNVEHNGKTDVVYELDYLAWMAPEVNLIVFYYSFHGEFIFDAIKFKNSNILRNQVAINIISGTKTGRNSVTLEPGDELDIDFKLTPDSDINTTLHITSIDKRVQLLDKDRKDDISLIMLLKKFKQLFRVDPVVFKTLNDLTDSRYQILNEYNTFFITNAFVMDNEIKCDSVQQGGRKNVIGLRTSHSNEEDEIDIFPTPPNSERPSIVRTEFPETFLFNDVAGKEIKNGIYSLSTQAPHSITSYLVNAFTFHPEHGLGVSKMEASFTVVQNLFIKVYLPYSIHVGETLKVDTAVYNYIKNSVGIDAKVRIEKVEGSGTGDFEFVQLVPDDSKTCKVQRKNVAFEGRTISIDENTGSSSSFFIQATRAGVVKIRFFASTKGFNDTVIRELNIEHAGTSETINSAFLVDLRNKKSDNHHFECRIGSDYEKDSLHVSATVYGNLLGQALIDTENMIQMPGGCSEQTFMSWIPNIAAYDYLMASSDPNKEENLKKIIKNVKFGYQRIIERSLFKDDGSFSIWGESGESNIWLTAYIVKLLSRAKHVIKINDKYIKNSLDFLAQHQRDDGRFESKSHISHYSSNNSSSSIPLTSFVISSFLESGYVNTAEKYRNIVDKGNNFIFRSAVKIDENFARAIASYAVSLYNSQYKTDKSADFLHGILGDLLRNGEDSSDTIHWLNERSTGRNIQEIHSSIHIEIASYAMMALRRADNSTHPEFSQAALKVVKWMMEKKNSNGGFESTYDTALAISALSEMSSDFQTSGNDLRIKLSYDKNVKLIRINEANLNAVQQIKLDMKPNFIQNVHLQAEGTGIGFAAVSCNFVRKVKDAKSSFDLSVGSTLENDEKIINLRICTNYIGDKSTGMAIVEVNLPSGFKFKEAAKMFERLQGGDTKVRRLDLEKMDTIANLYFDYFDKVRRCFEVKGYRVFDVANLKSTPVRVYNYYTKNEQTTVFYVPLIGSSCL